MANLKTDSPLSRRIVLSFLDFLNSVEPAVGVDLEGLEVAKECLADIFKVDQSINSPSNPDSLVDIFRLRESTERETNSNPSCGQSSADAPSLSSAPTKDIDWTGEVNTQGTSKDEIFGQFFGALEKIHYFKTMPDGNDDQDQIDSATRIFHSVIAELEKSGCQTYDKKNVADVLKSQGNNAMQSKLYPDAIELYTFAIALVEDNAVFHCNRAAAYTQINQYTEAIKDCVRSIEIDPNYGKAYSRLGFAYYAQGNYRDAIDKGFTKAKCIRRSSETEMQNPSNSPDFKIGQRVHSVGDTWRIGTVKYVGSVEGYSGNWVGIDWDNNGDGKHDGSVNGVRYFEAKSPTSASFVRPQNLSPGISLLEALELRYRSISTKEEEDEMYVLSANNKRVSIKLVGKDKVQDKLNQFENLRSASLFYSGVSSCGPSQISASVPNLKELDLTGNLLSDWKDVATICYELPTLVALNLSYNIMSRNLVGSCELKRIKILVLNNTGLSWTEVEILKVSLPEIEELHLMGNKLGEIQPTSSTVVQGFNSLRLLNLEDNNLSDWNEILKLSQLQSLEQLHLNKNNLNCIWFPDNDAVQQLLSGYESFENSFVPFPKLSCLLLGNNNIGDLASVDSLNSFPRLTDIRLSENPVTEPGKGGIGRFILIARLSKVQILNGSEVSPRERKDSEIRYVRLVMSKFNGNKEEIKQLHPRFSELKKFHGIADEKPSNGAAGPQKMGSSLISITMKCIGASIGEKPQMTKKIPATITIGKLKNLCESFFKLKLIKPVLFLQEEGSPMPTVLDDDMVSLIDAGVCNESTVLIDEEG